MSKLFYNTEVTLSSENSKKLVEDKIKSLPRNAVLYYPRGGQFIQWPAFGGHVTEEWLSKNRCPGEQAPPCGTPLVMSSEPKIPNTFPATELLIVTRVEGGALRKEVLRGNDFTLEQSDEKSRENELLKNKVDSLEKQIGQLELGSVGVQEVPDQSAEIALLKNKIASLEIKIRVLEEDYYHLERSHEDGMRGISTYPYEFQD
ncbi:unnamed protein product [Caenorhabditis nigoni]